VIVLRLQLPANQNFQYRAGQYVEFILRDGARRSYSMANAPHRLGSPPSIELHLRHMPGGLFTDHVFATMKEKDILRMEGPFGSFFLREDRPSRSSCWPAGTGFAPIKALIEQLQRQGSPPGLCCTGAAAARPTCTCTTGAGQQAAGCRLRYVPVLSEPTADDAWPAAPAWCTRR
jgi:CDP-4-dehydro-6-deoxyglucose reductase